MPRTFSDAEVMGGGDPKTFSEEEVMGGGEEPGFFARAYQGAKDLVTGDKTREFDYGELPKEFATRLIEGKGMIGPKLGWARTDRGKLDILSELDPETANTAQVDKFGNAYVQVGGKPYYLNRPGLSGADMDELQANLLATIAPGMILGPAAVGTSLPVRLGAAGLIGGAGSVGQDVGAQMQGSKQPIDWPAAGVSAAAGATFEGLSPIAKTLFSKIVGSPSMYDAERGVITQAGRDALKRVGFGDEEITDDLGRVFATMAGAENQRAAANKAAAESLPVPVPQTMGNLTGNPRTQLRESIAEKGGYGELPSAMMRGQIEKQQDALRANVPAIQARLSGRDTAQVTAQGEAGARAQSFLSGQEQAAKKAVNDAYEQARQGVAGIGDETAVEGANLIKQAVAADHTLKGLPRTNAILDDLDDVMRVRNEGSDVLVRSLFDWRKRASAARATGGEESVALRKAINQFDNWMGDVVDQALVKGDQAAIDAYKKAIGMRADYGQRYQAKDIVQRLTEGTGTGENRVLAVAPEAASSLLFGGSDAGFIAKPQLVRTFQSLKKTLPADEWNAVREEAFMRIASQAEGAYQGAERGFSGIKFKKSWDDFSRKNPALVAELFDSDERALIGQLAKVAANTTGKVRGGDNPSNTFVAAMSQIPGLKSLLKARDAWQTTMGINPSLRGAENPLGAGVLGGASEPAIEGVYGAIQ